jgi:hypothetical protein
MFSQGFSKSLQVNEAQAIDSNFFNLKLLPTFFFSFFCDHILFEKLSELPLMLNHPFPSFWHPCSRRRRSAITVVAVVKGKRNFWNSEHCSLREHWTHRLMLTA